MVLHNDFNDYHFIIKELPEEFKGNFVCLGEIVKKYKTVSTTIQKWNECKLVRTYNITFIRGVQFMSSSLSHPNLTEGLHKGKFKNYKSSLKYGRDSKLTFKCMECDQSYD